jgi:DNA-binding NtrC family response regulator
MTGAPSPPHVHRFEHAANTLMTDPISDDYDPQAKGFAHAHVILIVEDEKLIAWDVEMLLKAQGAASVVTALNLAEARKILKERQDISLALVDLRLPDGSGEEIIGELLALNIAVVVLTGYSAAPIANTLMVAKPYTAEQLLRTVQQAIVERIAQRRGRNGM